MDLQFNVTNFLTIALMVAIITVIFGAGTHVYAGMKS
jgi:hypothetical protein